jgi:hypothetical protein
VSCVMASQQQRTPNSSGHSRGQDSGRSGGGHGSGRHNEPVPPPPPQQDSGKHKEKNNGYVVRPPGSEPLAGHPRYTKIREINSGKLPTLCSGASPLQMEHACNGACMQWSMQHAACSSASTA